MSRVVASVSAARPGRGGPGSGSPSPSTGPLYRTVASSAIRGGCPQAHPQPGVWLRPADQVAPHIPRERYERSAGPLRSVAVISMNCSASSLPPGSVRSVIGTEQAELVSALRRADAACNVTPIVGRRWIARGRLPQPPWTPRQIHELRDLDDAGRRLPGPWAVHGTETRWTQGCTCCLSAAKQKLTL